MQFGGVFSRDKLPLSFILTIGVRWFIGLLGFVLNFSLVYVTWKTKKFRQLCNSLIAANAFFSGLFGLSLSIGWAFILAGQPFMFEGHCVVLQAVPLLCRNLGLNLLFWIGFDRLISALFMNSFLHRHNSFYYLLITIGSASHAGYIVISVIGMAIDYPDHINLCSTHDDTYVGPTALTLMLVNVILSAIIFLVYVLLALVIKFKKETSVNSEVTRRLLCSLMAIMFVVVAGFTLNNFVNVLYSLLDTNITAITKAYTSMALSCLMAIAYASNAPLLIMFSTEYRKAYLRTFGPFLERLHLNTAAMSGAQKVQQTINNNNSKTVRHPQKKIIRNLAKVSPMG